MKKSICLFLSIMIMHSFLPLGHAEGLNATIAYDGPAGNIHSACEVNDIMYIVGNYGVFKWDYKAEIPSLLVDLSMFQKNGLSSAAPKNAAGKDLWEQGMSKLFALDGMLYGLHPYTGQVFRIADQKTEPVAILPKEQFFYTDQEVLHPKEIVSIITAGNTLYLVLASFTAEEGDVRELYAWDLTNPQMELLNAPGMTAAFPGTDDTLILRVASKEAEKSTVWMYDINAQKFIKQIWDETQETGTGYAWNSKDQSLYFTGNNGKVKKVLTDGKTQTKAYLPFNFQSSSDQAFISSGGDYVYLGMSSLFVRDISQEGESKQTIVRIMGQIGSTISIAYSSRRPDIALVIESTGSDFLSIQQSMVSGDSDIDLYMVNTTRSYQDIRDKGYAAPMDANQHLVELSNQFFPAIRSVLYQDGHIIAFPAMILPGNWSINRTKWNELNLGEFPTTFAEFFEIADRWNEEYAQNYPNDTLLETPEGFFGFVAFIIKQYLLQYETGEKPVNFDSPDFRDAITSAWEHRELLDTPAEGSNALIMTYNLGYGVALIDSDVAISIPPPALTRNSPRMVMAALELFILNPLSASKEAALDFLTFYADHMGEGFKYSLNATLNTPLRRNRYEEEQKGILDQIAYLEQMMKSADELEKEDYQAMIDQEKARYDRKARDDWLISQESIDIYQKLAEKLVVPTRSIFINDRSQNDQTIEQVIRRFADGQLSVDQFIQELNQKAQMIYMEGQ